MSRRKRQQRRKECTEITISIPIREPVYRPRETRSRPLVRRKKKSTYEYVELEPTFSWSSNTILNDLPDHLCHSGLRLVEVVAIQHKK